jgi:hypothetical protein
MKTVTKAARSTGKAMKRMMPGRKKKSSRRWSELNRSPKKKTAEWRSF